MGIMLDPGTPENTAPCAESLTSEFGAHRCLYAGHHYGDHYARLGGRIYAWTTRVDDQAVDGAR